MKSSLFNNLSNRAYYTLVIAITFVVVVLLNVIVSFFDFRVDFTADKRYSLSPTTVDFLTDDTKLTNRILFKIYLDGELPAEVKRLRTAIKDKLNELKYYAGKRIEYEFIDPNTGSLEDQKALKEQLLDRGRGIRPVEVSYRSGGKTNLIEFFPGAIVEYEGATVDYIRFFQGGPYRLDQQLDDQIQRSITAIEYKLMQSIAKATRKTKKTLAFIHGHGELGIPFTQGARRNIEDTYIIKDILLNESIDALEGVDGIIIADPTKKFSEKEKFIIDQYLMNGGNIMLFYNPLNINNDTIRRKGMVHSTRKRTGLDKLVFDYGIKINEDLVVDANYDAFIFPGIPRGYVNWYFYVFGQGTDHPISSMVDPVKLPYVSSLQFVKTKNNTIPAVILTSSSNAKSYGNTPLLSIAIEQNFGENPIFQDDPDNPDNKILLGAIIEGEFESAYKNRIVDTYANDPNARFQESSVASGKLMVVGNGTFFKNTYYDSVFVTEKGAYRYIPRVPRGKEIDELLASGRLMGNFDFFENCVDYMLGESTLLSIRSRTIDLHPMDKLKIEQFGTYYKVITILIPLLFILFLGIVIYYIRRLKYAK